ncbi:MAG: DUF3990 domain-containing protein [Bacteroidales bacterium]|nr:DUF3990 domain-containing protein [Candidatus Minthousia equi]
MILYHGTNTYFENIDLTKCNQYKDFGQAFYLTDQFDQASEVAKSRVEFFGGTSIILQFEFNETYLTDGTLTSKIFPAEYTDEWSDFIFLHRDETKVPPYMHSFDYVYGPIANDRVGLQVRKFRNGEITKEQFRNKLHFMKGITMQYAFCTLKAIQLLTFKGHILCK